MFGQNEQHKMFGKKVEAAKVEMGKQGAPAPKGEGAGTKTEITHHEDGSHSVKHADGDSTGPHEHLHHAMMAIHGKHHGGDSAHIAHAHGEGVTTHHVGADGEPQGPEEHPDAESAAASMPGNLDSAGGEMAMAAPDGGDESWA